jgi:replicative DNA helicase
MSGDFDLSIDATAQKWSVDKVAFFECLETGAFSFHDIAKYEKTIAELATRRRKIAEYETFIAQMKNPEFQVVADSFKASYTKQSMKEEVLNEWKVKEKIKLSQFMPLADKIHTFNPGHVMVLAGTSGTGKTNAAIQFAEDVSVSNGEEWLFVSQEMAKHDVVERCAKIRFYQDNPHGTRYESNMFFHQNKDIPEFYDAITPEHMNMYDETGKTIDQIGSVVKYEVSKNPKIKTVVIDYAQLLRGAANEYERLSYISTQCPIIAKKYGVRIILLCQLKKDAYDNRRPTRADIKGAGGLYDNADIVLCLYKDGSVENNRTLEVLHWKDRPNGSEGTTRLTQYGLYISPLTEKPTHIHN